MRRHRPPALVSMWMLDVFCCALGCVTLLWLLKTREAGQSADEAAQAAVQLAETRDRLDDSERLSAQRLADATRLNSELDTVNHRLALVRQERDEHAKNLALTEKARDAAARELAVVRKDRDDTARQLALVQQERDDQAKHLAVTEEALRKAKQDVAVARKDNLVARARAEDLEKTVAALADKVAMDDAELSRRRAELDAAKKQISDLDLLARAKEKARGDLEGQLRDADSKLKDSDRKLADASQLRARIDQLDRDLAAERAKLTDANKALTDQAKLQARIDQLEKDRAADRDKLVSVSRSAGDAARLQAKVDELEKEARAEKTKLDAANVTIVDLQGVKARLADRLNQLQVETDSRFAGIAMTGKNVVFLVDMSGSMSRVDENTVDEGKWPTVRETLCKVMRSIPTLEQFQVILFSDKVRYLLESGDWIPYEKEKSIERVRKAMAAVRPAEDTNLYAGMEEAFRYRSKGLDTIYFFSDGLPTSGPGLTAAQDKALVNESDRSPVLAKHIRRTLTAIWNRADGPRPRVKINSIGFFFESPDVGAFLWALSRENDGSFVGMSKP